MWILIQMLYQAFLTVANRLVPYWTDIVILEKLSLLIYQLAIQRIAIVVFIKQLILFGGLKLILRGWGHLREGHLLHILTLDLQLIIILVDLWNLLLTHLHILHHFAHKWNRSLVGL